MLALDQLDPEGTRNSDHIQRHGVSWKPIAIEVDGHAFHERTREQVERRNERDRALQQAGWTVFHFSFTEMSARPEACILEVFDFAHKQLMECLEAANARVRVAAV